MVTVLFGKVLLSFLSLARNDIKANQDNYDREERRRGGRRIAAAGVEQQQIRQQQANITTDEQQRVVAVVRFLGKSAGK